MATALMSDLRIDIAIANSTISDFETKRPSAQVRMQSSTYSRATVQLECASRNERRRISEGT